MKKNNVPQVGDLFKMRDNSVVVVVTVAYLGDCYQISCRKYNEKKVWEKIKSSFQTGSLEHKKAKQIGRIDLIETEYVF